LLTHPRSSLPSKPSNFHLKHYIPYSDQRGSGGKYSVMCLSGL
jgi:hypothetical protein